MSMNKPQKKPLQAQSKQPAKKQPVSAKDWKWPENLAQKLADELNKNALAKVDTP